MAGGGDGPSEYDFNYVEVWPPYVSYGDIEWIIREAYANSRGKPTVIAAYVDPEQEATVRLLNAIIFANGGTHIEMGEGDGMLADPYFPKFRRVSPSLWQARSRRTTLSSATRNGYTAPVSLRTLRPRSLLTAGPCDKAGGRKDSRRSCPVARTGGRRRRESARTQPD